MSKRLPIICPCRTLEDPPRNYVDCCAPAHNGTPAPTPEVLMRSRFSAYGLGLLDYILSTWHPSHAPGDLDLPPTQWIGLEVLAHQETGDAGVVEFIARYKINGKAEKVHEISRFVREQGKWLYVDGVTEDERSFRPATANAEKGGQEQGES
jgi:SEC-C motif domain protein